MEVNSISGYWTGKIIYGDTYGDQMGQMLYFDAIITQVSDQINGHAIDTSGWGMNPHPATLSGTFTGGKLNFVKQYVVFQALTTDNNVLIDDDQSGPEIYYTGLYNSDTGMITGTWDIKWNMRFMRLFPYKRSIGNGTWSMNRKETGH